MGMIRRWHSNSFSGKMTEIYICRAYPSRITRNWLVFRYQEIEFRLHPRVESRDDLFGNQTRPSNTRFPYPKAHLPPICLVAVFVSLILPLLSPSRKNPTEKPGFPLFRSWPTPSDDHRSSHRWYTALFDERKVPFLSRPKDPKTEACPWWKGRV